MSVTDPIANANLWQYFVLGGMTSPGTIGRDGVRGFERETGWDRKKGKGTQGATLTLTTQPPCEGSFTLQLFRGGGDASLAGANDFINWNLFVAKVLSISPAKQKAQGLNIYYAGFNTLSRVVVHKYSEAPRHVGKGLYLVDIHLIEWTPPPAISIVSTVKKTAPDLPDTESLDPPDPEADAKQAQIKTLSGAAFGPAGTGP